jgi:ABC-type uncharacterized transport system involved in gliding motility auxiliary subunit
MRLALTRQWLHLALVVLLVFGIAGFVQALSERHSVRWDFTPTRAFSLSEPTRKVLATLTDPIQVVLFYSREDYEKTADLMRLFKGAAPNFTYELLDLDRYPGRARQEGIDKYAKAAIHYRGEKVIVDASREQTIAGGLIYIARGRPTSIRFLEGHGERDLGEMSVPIGYGEVKQALAQESYSLGSLNLVKEGDVPADTDLVIVAGPKNDLLESEVGALDRYLDRGGHLMLLIDPVPLPNLERLATRRGIEPSLDIVIDRSNRLMASDPFTIPIPTFRSHPITSASGTPALFAVARSVDTGKGPAGAELEAIAQTYPDAWAMRDFERAGNVREEPHEPDDRKGPVPVMAAAAWRSDNGSESRLVVVGDSDFAANSLFDLLGNRDLFLNAVSWSVSAESLIAARPPSEVSALKPISPLVLSGRQGQWIFLLLVIGEPALVLGLGGTVALRKRWRG